jgi:uncharacterized repeat protein (TIGR03803 family)
MPAAKQDPLSLSIRNPESSRCLTLALFIVIAVVFVGLPAHAQTLTVLHSFVGPEGQSPMSGLIADGAGNFYGTASFGGVSGCGTVNGGGTVFRMERDGTTTALHAFTGVTDGCFPWSSLVRDGAGNLYGTTMIDDLFEIDASGNFSVLHNFSGQPDGSSPAGNLVRDANDNLYGVTTSGGGSNLGTVYEMTASGEETILYSFAGGADGAYPSGLFRDAAGNFYGTTVYGGPSKCDLNFGCGTVFKLDPAGNETVLYSFGGGPDGAYPLAGVISDAAGNLYGTTSAAEYKDCAQFGCGTVFRLSPAGKLTSLHTFRGGTDGQYPTAGLIRDAAGNLYGTTVYGGDLKCNCGIVFELTATGKLTILHRFTGSPDGAFPYGGLLRDSAGHLFGTTDLGGVNDEGTIFKLTP